MLGVLFVSIPVLRVEDDHPGRGSIPAQSDFNPRPPCGGRPQVNFKAGGGLSFQSASSVRRTTSTGGQPASPAAISIRVLRVEDDSVRAALRTPHHIFQSTSSVWRTTFIIHTNTPLSKFQSTSSVWRTTVTACAMLRTGLPFQSTSSVWRTTFIANLLKIVGVISIHVLRVEDDSHHTHPGSGRNHFNPRPPCGGRHGISLFLVTISSISIHVLRVEDDFPLKPLPMPHLNFNPRPPCGGRPTNIMINIHFCLFQSTSSVWRTT